MVFILQINTLLVVILLCSTALCQVAFSVKDNPLQCYVWISTGQQIVSCLKMLACFFKRMYPHPSCNDQKKKNLKKNKSLWAANARQFSHSGLQKLLFYHWTVFKRYSLCCNLKFVILFSLFHFVIFCSHVLKTTEVFKPLQLVSSNMSKFVPCYIKMIHFHIGNRSIRITNL